MFKNKYNLIILVLGLVFVLGGCVKKDEKIEVKNDKQPVVVDNQSADNNVDNSNSNSNIDNFKVESDDINIDNWLAYWSEEYGFEMKHPKSWEIDTFKNKIEIKNTIKEIILGGIAPEDGITNPSKYEDHFAVIVIDIYKNVSNLSWNDFFNKERPGTVSKFEEYKINDKISGIKITKLEGIMYGDPSLFFKEGKNVYSIHFINSDTEEKQELNKNIFNQFLSTFKFTDQEIVNIEKVDAKGWLAYNSKELNLKMKYPKDWSIVKEKRHEDFLTLDFDTGYKIIKDQKSLIITIWISKYDISNLYDSDKVFNFLEETDFKYNLINGAKAVMPGCGGAWDCWQVNFMDDNNYFAFAFDLNIPSGIGDNPEPMSLYVSSDTIPTIKKMFRLMIKSLERIE